MSAELTLWLGATRYYLGRTTYAVQEFCTLLISEWPSLDLHTRTLIKRDCETEFARDDMNRACNSQWSALGHDCDRAAWDEVRKLWSKDEGVA